MLVNRCCNFWRQKCDGERKEKILKYKDFIIGIQRMWNVKAKNGTSNKRGDWNHFRNTQYLSNVPGKHVIKELQKEPYLVPHTYCGKC